MFVAYPPRCVSGRAPSHPEATGQIETRATTRAERSKLKLDVGLPPVKHVKTEAAQAKPAVAVCYSPSEGPRGRPPYPPSLFSCNPSICHDQRQSGEWLGEGAAVQFHSGPAAQTLHPGVPTQAGHTNVVWALVGRALS